MYWRQNQDKADCFDSIFLTYPFENKFYFIWQQRQYNIGTQIQTHGYSYAPFRNNSISKINKKVLLRERKRHTDCSVSSTPSVTWVGVPPPPQQGYPPARSDRGYLRWGTPPGQVWWGYLRWGIPSRGTPPEPGWGTPPPLSCGLTNKVKLLPPVSYYVRGR